MSPFKNSKLPMPHEANPSSSTSSMDSSTSLHQKSTSSKAPYSQHVSGKQRKTIRGRPPKKFPTNATGNISEEMIAEINRRREQRHLVDAERAARYAKANDPDQPSSPGGKKARGPYGKKWKNQPASQRTTRRKLNDASVSAEQANVGDCISEEVTQLSSSSNMSPKSTTRDVATLPKNKWSNKVKTETFAKIPVFYKDGKVVPPPFLKCPEYGVPIKLPIRKTVCGRPPKKIPDRACGNINDAILAERARAREERRLKELERAARHAKANDPDQPSSLNGKKTRGPYGQIWKTLSPSEMSTRSGKRCQAMSSDYRQIKSSIQSANPAKSTKDLWNTSLVKKNELQRQKYASSEPSTFMPDDDCPSVDIFESDHAIMELVIPRTDDERLAHTEMVVPVLNDDGEIVGHAWHDSRIEAQVEGAVSDRTHYDNSVMDAIVRIITDENLDDRFYVFNRAQVHITMEVSHLASDQGLELIAHLKEHVLLTTTLLIPFCDNIHWHLLVVDVVTGRIRIFDPFQGLNVQEILTQDVIPKIRRLRTFLRGVYPQAAGFRFCLQLEWTSEVEVYEIPEIPSQADVNNSGPIVAEAIRWILRRTTNSLTIFKHVTQGNWDSIRALHIDDMSRQKSHQPFAPNEEVSAIATHSKNQGEEETDEHN